MFLLILIVVGGNLILRCFNTSHVSINRVSYMDRISLYGFNTSHVSINRGRRMEFRAIFIVSIHLMFLLILQRQSTQKELKGFNTSHVSINHPGTVNFLLRPSVSIHLMFLLIWKRNI